MSDIQISSKELNEIVSRYNIGEVLKIERLTTSGNISYLIETASDKYILRLCPEGHRSRSIEEIAAELELLEYLQKNKFPVLVALKDKTGQQIISWQNHNGYIRKFSGGKEILDPTLEQIEIFGQILGRFHSLVENYKTKLNRTHIFDLNETKKYFFENRSEIMNSNFPQRRLFLEKYGENINKLNFPNDLARGMIHEDLGKRHVLWSDSHISAVIDFDRSYYGFLLLDLGQACRGWCFVEDWKKWSYENYKHLIGGYQKTRKLPGLEKEYLIDAVKFGILERAQSFYIKYLAMGDEKDAEFAFDCVTKQIGLLPEK
ncbi:MAG: phosphotransferase [Minisyncoccia bacterium]|jgi:homoserine kinase type II